MSTATYGDFRVALRRAGFALVRSRRDKVLPTGEILPVQLSHQYGRDVPTRLFHQMLHQARVTQAKFFELLRQG